VGACRDGEKEDGEHGRGWSREVLCASVVVGLFYSDSTSLLLL
jgi:hypothetical protein